MTMTMPQIQFPVSVGEVYEARAQGIIDVTLACISAMPLWGWSILVIVILLRMRAACLWLMRRALSFV